MNHIAKIIEVVGASDSGLEDAVTGVIKRAAETIHHMRWFEVTELPQSS